MFNEWNGITVKELIERLNKFDENCKVWVSGGEDECGEFAQLMIETDSDFVSIMEH